MQEYKDTNNRLNGDKIASMSFDNVIGSEIFYFDSLTSTFDKIKAMPLKNGTTIVTSKQTQGVGRLGRSWESSYGGIYLTFAITDLPSGMQLNFMPIACALGVCMALSKYLPTQIKWPNDIVYSGKKLCGILAKNLSVSGRVDSVLTGIGINANNVFTAALPYAASLGGILKREIDENLVLEEVLKSIDYILYGMSQSQILKEYKERCVNITKETKVLINGKECSGICTDILADGSMELTTREGTLIVNSGEASVKGIYTKGNN